MNRKQQFHEKKIERFIRLLERARWVDMTEIKSFAGLKGTLGEDEVYKTCPEEPFPQMVQVGASFNGRDRYLWIEKKIDVPKKQKGLIPAAFFDFGKTGVNNKFGFESLLYVNGKPYQGVDGNHHEVMLGEFAGRQVKLTFLLWTGLEGGGPKQPQKHKIKCARYGLFDIGVNKFYYLFKNCADTVKVLELEEKEADRAELIRILNETIRILQNQKQAFRQNVDAASCYLENALKKHETDRDVSVYVTGHTHIDVTWLWRIKHTREKTQRSFSTVLRLMEEYPEFRFVQSQPQLYQFLKEDNPALYRKIKKRVAEKRWEADGGMWLEADCNLPGGESLVRQFLYGNAYFEKEFHKRCTYLWLPDVFGYSWSLPQIMKLCGIDTFMTTKISWNDTNEMPDDLFVWKGVDGTEILTYFMNTPNNNERSVKYGKVSNYSATLAPLVTYGAWRRFKNKEVSRDLLIAYGFGDGGGGPTREMVENALAMEKIPWLPEIKFALPGELFEQLHENARQNKEKLRSWNDELYLELHRATYTTQAQSKRQNRKLEYALLESEYLSALSRALGGKGYEKTLHSCWEQVLQAQFHDNIPGSSIQEVYEDTAVLYDAVRKKLQGVRKSSGRKLFRQRANVCSLLRFADVAGEELAAVAEDREGNFYDEAGRLLPSQKTEDGYVVRVKLEPLVPKTICFQEEKRAKEPVRFSADLKERQIETPHYTVCFDEHGVLTSIFDKDACREVLRGKGNILRCYENRPKEHDAWDIDSDYMESYEDVTFQHSELVEAGSLRAVVRFFYKYHTASELTQDLIFYADSRRIDFKTSVSWYEDHRLLRALFQVNVESETASYDSQFAYLKRAAQARTSREKAKFEVCAHKWSDLSQEDYGVSLLNDCKYGYSTMGNVMGISLLNSPKYPNPMADMGFHEFTYSLLPHKGGLSLETMDEGMLLNEPAMLFKGEAMTEKRLLVKDNPGIKLDALKPAEDGDGYVLHLHEALGERQQVSLASDFKIREYASCNLLEEYDRREKGSVIHTDMNAFEIRAYRIWLEEGGEYCE